MSLVGDMVVQQANSPGTGSCNLIPVAGRSTLVSQNGAGLVFYFMQDSASWEKGIGTVTAGSPDTLSRDTVLGNSLGTTARINFAGAVTIECDIPAERAIWADESNVLQGQGRRFTGLTPATLPGDVPQYGQLGEVMIGKATLGSVGGAVLIIPSGYIRYELGWTLACPTTAGKLFLRFSKDGSTFDSNVAYYYSTKEIRSTVQGDVYTGNPANSLIELNGISSANQLQNGELFLSGTFGGFRNQINDSSGLYYNQGAFAYSFTPKQLLIAHTSGGNFNGGEIWLKGILP